MTRNALRTTIGITTTVIAAAAASLLAPVQTAEASPASQAKMFCNNMACYGPNTCERHTGGDCDLYAMPGACVTSGCNQQ